MTSIALEYARLYLRHKIAVLPVHFPRRSGRQFACSCGRDDCGQPAKHPYGRLVQRGVRDATTDYRTVERWFASTPYNIALATGSASGIFVLDVDPRHGGDDSLAALEEAHGPLPNTWRFLTGGGGEHILFRHPGSVRVPNSAGNLGRGLDVRGDGGIIVAPPSLHITGRPYAISVDHHPDEVPLAVAPDWLLQRLGARPTNTRVDAHAHPRVDWRAVASHTVPQGQRNTTIAKLAGLLLGKHIDPHVCLDLLLAFNAARCNPPLDEREVATIVASIWRREVSNKRS